MAAPVFIDNNPELILSQCIARYEQLTNKTLFPAQAERIMIDVLAYREHLTRSGVQASGETQLIDFSSAPMLDYLVAILNVVRLPAQFAITRLEFTLVQGHNGVTIPQGIRVQSVDGLAAFETTSSVFVPAGTYVVEVAAACTEAGTVGNGYAANNVNVILDPLPYVVSAINVLTTEGGADAESDDQLRARFKLAADTYSTAGPYAAYKFHAMSAHPTIVDVAVLGPNEDVTILPTHVYLYPLVAGGGATPQPVLDAVLASCNGDTRRPLTDVVSSYSPTPINYDIEIELTCFTGSVDQDVEDQVNESVNTFAQSQKKKLGRDVLIGKIESFGYLNPQVYNVAVIQPAADLIIGGNEFANIGTITINVVAHTNG